VRIRRYLFERVAVASSPRQFGKPLVGSRYGELWRYRVGDYRLICQIKDGVLIVLVLEIGHRSSIYRGT
jgi:mRNA interferase RelE/StbE